MKRLPSLVVAFFAVALCANANANPVVLSGVPAYLWHDGCAPTSAGMIFGYYDGNGYDKFFPGSAETPTPAVLNLIASAEHYADYSLPLDVRGAVLPDKSTLNPGGAHADNCIADFMMTSRSAFNLWYGATMSKDIDDGMIAFAQFRGYQANSWNESWGVLTFSDLVHEVNRGRPLILRVDSDADGETDHAVCAIGYDDLTTQFACLNTWDSDVRWYDFAPLAVGQNYGVSGATYFVIVSEPFSGSVALALMCSALGMFCICAHHARRVR